MTDERIEQVTEFFYSSDDQAYVPLRLSIAIGQFRGYDLDPVDCRDLLTILSNSQHLKNDLEQFLSRFVLD